MEVLNIKREEYESGIPLSGLESVKAALSLFYSGKTNNSGATTNQLVRDGGGLAAVFKTIAESGHEDAFLKRMFSEMESSIKERGMFSHSYDYDGMGPFFKTTVEVKTVDQKQGLYLLSMHAAYVGKKVEEGLAEALGAERGLQWVHVGIEIPPVNGRFEIDFQEVMEKLAAVPDLAKISGVQAVKTIMTEDKWGHSTNLFLLTAAEYAVFVFPDFVERMYNYHGGKKEKVWSGHGSVLLGPLESDWNDETHTKMFNPVIMFSICSRHEQLPILKPETKKEVRDLAEKIAAAFGGR